MWEQNHRCPDYLHRLAVAARFATVVRLVISPPLTRPASMISRPTVTRDVLMSLSRQNHPMGGEAHWRAGSKLDSKLAYLSQKISAASNVAKGQVCGPHDQFAPQKNCLTLDMLKYDVQATDSRGRFQDGCFFLC